MRIQCSVLKISYTRYGEKQKPFSLKESDRIRNIVLSTGQQSITVYFEIRTDCGLNLKNKWVEASEKFWQDKIPQNDWDRKHKSGNSLDMLFFRLKQQK